MEQGPGWRTRWRVTRDLRQGRPITDEERPLARAVINSFSRSPSAGWAWLPVGFVWFYVATLAHGGLRAVDMATGVVSVAGGMYQIAMRRRILARKAEMTLPDYP